jgi:hypothetical protein
VCASAVKLVRHLRDRVQIPNTQGRDEAQSGHVESHAWGRRGRRRVLDGLLPRRHGEEPDARESGVHGEDVLRRVRRRVPEGGTQGLVQGLVHHGDTGGAGARADIRHLRADDAPLPAIRSGDSGLRIDD